MSAFSLCGAVADSETVVTAPSGEVVHVGTPRLYTTEEVAPFGPKSEGNPRCEFHPRLRDNRLVPFGGIVFGTAYPRSLSVLSFTFEFRGRFRSHPEHIIANQLARATAQERGQRGGAKAQNCWASSLDCEPARAHYA